jgi:subtilisin family serine protease
MKTLKHWLQLFLIFGIAFSLFQTSAEAFASPAATRRLSQAGERISPEAQALLAQASPDERVTVIVTLDEQADLSRIPGASRAARLQGIIRALQETADHSQRPLRTYLAEAASRGKAGRVVPFWIFNGLSVAADAETIQALAQFAEVASITADAIDARPAGLLAQTSPQPNLAVINVPALWGSGWMGQGVVVASLDTGVDLSHPDLSGRWRGGANSWFDPYGQHAAPADLSGHGTQTMGVILGGDGSGTSIGVAPQAQWIAAKIFNDAGSATATGVHLSFQWLLDPDGDPGSNDAPQVVNNSWTFGSPGCNLEFQLDLQALRAAGILPVFSAGNFGPAGFTSASPANYPEAFAVGAVDNSDGLYALSSRGPSACGETESIYPELVAPGVEIFTADLGGFYTTASGTSLAAPHVSGALAILLSAFPGLSAEQQASALINGAFDLASAGADNETGFGRLDALAAYQWLLANGGGPTPTPAPLPTSTPTPTPSLPTLHIGDLDASASLSKKNWSATVTVRVHDAGEKALSGVNVSATWSGGIAASGSCVTDRKGVCKISSGSIPNTASSVNFSVSDASRSGYVYALSANHDPDGDSNGLSLTVVKP